MRGKLVYGKKRISAGKNAKTFQLPAENSGICEIMLDIDAGKAADVNLALSNNQGDKVIMKYNPAARTLSFDRTESGIVDFSESFPTVTVTPTFEDKGRISLRIFVDRSSIEVFEKSGRFVMTNLVFPNAPYTTLSVSSSGASAKIENLKIYSISK